MKSLFLSTFILVSAVAVAGQSTGVDKTFERNRSKYTREHFAMGEDASSGYDYVFYKSASRIVMIRSIWSASYSNELRIDDFYFDKELSLHRRQTAAKRQLSVLKRGRDVPLTVKEELHFANGRLTKCIEKKKAVPTSDSRWAKAEKDALERASSERESYSWLKAGK